jgi:uncharacterized membrane protein YedE/YeeE
VSLATTAATSERRDTAPDNRVVAAACLALALVTLAAWGHAGLRQGALACVGFGAGIALSHASFGFASAWRGLIVRRSSRGLRAQLLMIAGTIVVFFPLIAQGEVLGQPAAGFVSPVGLALVAGAFLFGIGMQLGGGCASGTLYTAGGGDLRMAVTLAAFVAGSLLATADPGGWTRWRDIGAFSLVASAGPVRGAAIALGIIAVLYAAATAWERRAHGAVEPLTKTAEASLRDIFRGPWPLLWGAGALAAVNIATLVLAGRPWGVTSAFALWGAKLALAAGIDVAAWPYWTGDPALTESVFADATSVMNFGLMLGALAATGAAGRFAPRLRLEWRALSSAVLGGLLMGLGARLASGCNIGAYFSGTASGSLHGPVWLALALVGSVLGIRLRPFFRLDR